MRRLKAPPKGGPARTPSKYFTLEASSWAVSAFTTTLREKRTNISPSSARVRALRRRPSWVRELASGASPERDSRYLRTKARERESLSSFCGGLYTSTTTAMGAGWTAVASVMTSASAPQYPLAGGAASS